MPEGMAGRKVRSINEASKGDIYIYIIYNVMEMLAHVHVLVNVQ